MTRQENSFALLGDEESDDVSNLLARVAAKVAASSPPAAADNKKEQQQRKNQQYQSPPAAPKPLSPAEYVRSERGRGRRGRGRGSGNSGGNDVEQFENGRPSGYRKNYGGADDYHQNNGSASGYQRNNGEASGNRRNYGGGDGYQQNYRANDRYQHTNGGNSAGSGGNWKVQGQGRGHGGSRGRGRGQGRGPYEEDHGFGNENQVIGDNQHLDSQGQGEGSVIRDERQLRNGNWNYDGERRGNGGGNLGFRVREGPSFRGRDGRNNGRDESMDDSDKKEAGDGNGRHATNVEDNTNGAEKNVLETIEVSKNVEPEQGKLDQLASQDDSKKKAQEEEEENNKMTLDEYEKLLIEKRKALEALKIEERKVALDKDFELMQLVEKKKEDSLFIKLNSEKDKLKKDSLDKDDKVRKVKSQQLLLGEIHIRGSGRGRGRRDPGGYRGGYSRRVAAVPAIGDSGQFPDLAKPVKA